ncbi:hypothetical protein XENORESO_001917 [Xenotaenia resolanae]|uniref:Uncharacterized protein n=1 Tax=Xenotaenia resolanae TaxID=208358 RepID=A0ABV0WUH6_9TELE
MKQRELALIHQLPARELLSGSGGVFYLLLTLLPTRCGCQKELDRCSLLSIQLGSIRGGLASTSLPERFALVVQLPGHFQIIFMIPEKIELFLSTVVLISPCPAAFQILTPRPDLIRPEPPDSVGTFPKSWILPCWRAVREDQPAERTLSSLPAHSVLVYFPAAENLGRLFHTLQALCPSVADCSTLSRKPHITFRHHSEVQCQTDIFFPPAASGFPVPYLPFLPLVGLYNNKPS